MSFTSYFAVEAKKGESSHDVASVVLLTATNLGIKFKTLESMDSITVGGATFVRFRSDLHQALPLLDALGRGTIALRAGGCKAILPGGRQGSYPMERLFMAPRQSKLYRGPGQPHAERQFTN
jgi:hypothetical protein